MSTPAKPDRILDCRHLSTFDEMHRAVYSRIHGAEFGFEKILVTAAFAAEVSEYTRRTMRFELEWPGEFLGFPLLVAGDEW